ncbi:MAG TPA: branched-chain amino acid ABC transporter permease [Chloroflexota bacterium]
MNLGGILIQLFNGLVNGSFYALISLGLAVIFGMMGVVNFAHGAFYMLGAFAAYVLLESAHVSFWWALIISPIAVAIVGMLVERTLVRWLYSLDPLYNFLLTFGLTLFIQDLVRLRFGVQGEPYGAPPGLTGATILGPFAFPNYRLFVIVFSAVVCVMVWYVIDRTRVGMVIRAATEKPSLTRALGVNVDRWVTPVFGFGIALAAIAGVLAAPMYNVSPLMGANLIIFCFAVVVIGGLGSIPGAVAAGFIVGLLGGIGALVNPALTNIVAFVFMAVVLLWRPSGLFGAREAAR